MKSLWYILAVAIAAGIASVLYIDSHLHPGFRFFTRAAELSDAWEAKLRAHNRSCYVFAGGSEVRAGIDPMTMLLKRDIAVVNAGEHAGYGLYSNASLALQYLRQGDTMILSLIGVEKNQLQPQLNGLKMLRLRFTPEILECGLINSGSQDLRKIVLGDYDQYSYFLHQAYKNWEKQKKWQVPPHYYDTNSKLHISGWMEIPSKYISASKSKPAAFSLKSIDEISNRKEVIHLLEKLTEWTQQKGVRLIVNFPVCYSVPERQVQNAFYMLQLTQRGIAVLRDKRLGVVTDPAYFSDTNWHLSRAGAIDNSEIIAAALKNNKIWTEEELIEELRQRGWNPDGSRISPNK